MPVERNTVRHIRVTAVNLTTGRSGALVSQQRLAHLLTLLPNLRKLDVSNWSSSKVASKLRQSLKGLVMLETLWFHAKVKVRGRCRACSAILAALPNGHCLRYLLLDLPLRAFYRVEPMIVPPPQMTVLHLKYQNSDEPSTILFDETKFTSFGSRLTVLDMSSVRMSSVTMSSEVLGSLGPTLKGLVYHASGPSDWLNIEMPHLTTIFCRQLGQGQHTLLSRRMVDLALFRHARTLLISLSKQVEGISGFVYGCTTLERLIVSDLLTPGPGARNVDVVQDNPLGEHLKSVLPKAKIEILAGTLICPDLLKLVETGGRVQELDVPPFRS